MGSGSSTARAGAQQQQQRQLIEAELEISSLKEKVEEGRMEKLRLENQRLWRELQQTKDAEARRREDAMQAELAQLRLQVHSKELAQAQNIQMDQLQVQSPLAQSPLAPMTPMSGVAPHNHDQSSASTSLSTGYFHHRLAQHRPLEPEPQRTLLHQAPTSARQLGRHAPAFATTGGYHAGAGAGLGMGQYGRYGGSASAPQSARYHSCGYGLGAQGGYGHAGTRDYRPPLPAGPPPASAVSARSASSMPGSQRDVEWLRASSGAQQRQRRHRRASASGTDSGGGSACFSARGERDNARNDIVVPRLVMPMPPPEPSTHPLLQQARSKRQHQALSTTPPSSSRTSHTITATTTSITSSKGGAQPVRSPHPAHTTGTDVAAGKSSAGVRQRHSHEPHGREARLRRESARARERVRMRHDVMHFSDDEGDDDQEDADDDEAEAETAVASSRRREDRKVNRIEPAVRPAVHVPSLRERMSTTTVSKRLSQHRLEQLRKISATDSSDAGSSYGSDTDSDGAHCDAQNRRSHDRARTGSGEEGRTGMSSSRSSASSTTGPAAGDGTRRRPQPKPKRRKMGDIDMARQHKERLQPLSSRTALRSTEKWTRVTTDRPAPAYIS